MSSRTRTPTFVFVAICLLAVFFTQPIFAAKQAGRIVSWGDQKTPDAPLTNITKIAAGSFHSLALKSEGSIVGWGRNDYGQATPPAGNSFIDIAVGSNHNLALKSDGSIIGWGGTTSMVR